MPMERVPTATKQMRQWRAVYDRKLEKWVARSRPHPRWLEAEGVLMANLEKHAPEKPIEGAVELDVCWCFPKRGHADGEPKVTPPDTDNLQKGLKDVMTRLGWWKDDAQVAVEHVCKIHSRITGVRVDITRLEV